MFDEEDKVFTKRFMAAFLAFTIVLTGVSLIFAHFGLANHIYQSITGSGSIDFSTGSSKSMTSDRALADNAKYVSYTSTRKWGEDLDGDGVEEEVLESEYVITVGDPGSPYRNQYKVKAKSALHSHEYTATQITGNFTGSANFVTTKTTQSSLILMDSRNGSATFRGRIINGTTGRPVTEAEADAVGKFFVESYLEISLKAPAPYDPLGLCKEIEDGLPDSLKGIKIDNWTIETPPVAKMGLVNK